MSSGCRDRTWLHPPAHVHKLIHDTWQPHGLPTSVQRPGAIDPSTSNAQISASAQESADGRTVVVRLANTGAARRVTVRLRHDASLPGSGFATEKADLWLMTAVDPLAANLPSEPTRVSPVRSQVDASQAFEMPAVSVAALVLVKRKGS